MTSNSSVYKAVPCDQRRGFANISIYWSGDCQHEQIALLGEQGSPTQQNNWLHINWASQSTWHSTSQPKPPFSSHVYMSCFIPMSQGNSFVFVCVCDSDKWGFHSRVSIYFNSEISWSLEVRLLRLKSEFEIKLSLNSEEWHPIWICSIHCDITMYGCIFSTLQQLI